MLLVVSPIFGQEAELKFDDNTTISAKLVETSVEVDTKFGKLSIPIKEIGRIEFGLNLSTEESNGIDKAIRSLGSDIMPERQKAEDKLLDYKYFALPALRHVLFSADMEVARRAKSIITQIEATEDKELCNLSFESVIYTPGFSVVGRIQNKEFKVLTNHFGEVTLKLSRLREATFHQGNTKLMMEAAKNSWRSTNYYVTSNRKFTVQATGTVDLFPMNQGQYTCSPKGYNTVGKGGQFMAGALIGKVGEKGIPFFIGENYRGSTYETGVLYLFIVESPWNNESSGSYNITVKDK